MTDSSGKIIDIPVKWGNEGTIAALHTLSQGEQPATYFKMALARTINTPTPRIASKGKYPVRVKVLHTSKRRKYLSPQLLARRWGTHLETAKRTLDATTQRGVSSILNPTMNRRYRTNNRQLRYRRLSHDILTDTLEASVHSWFRQNWYAQVFATDFGWCQVYPMKKKRDAHHGLSLMATRYGVPLHIIMDGSKEQTIGEFRKEARQFGCHIKQSEPYPPGISWRKELLKILSVALGEEL